MLPANLSRPCLGRQLEAILQEPHQCLPDTSNLSKLIEYEKHRFLKAPIWVLLQVIIITLFVTHWAGNKEFTTARFRISRFN
jgi:predicted anti-sigma-YlaC factor YlaD